MAEETAQQMMTTADDRAKYMDVRYLRRAVIFGSGVDARDADVRARPDATSDG